jgi:hypothetical protein
VVIDVKPVADVSAVAIERDVFAIEQVGDEERDDFLREVVNSVVVAASRDGGVQAVRHVIAANKKVTAGF